MILSFVLLCLPLFGQETASIDVFTMSSSFNDFAAVYAYIEATIYGGTVKSEGDYLAYWWDGDSWELQNYDVFWDPPESPGTQNYDDDAYVEEIAEKGNGNFKVLFRVFSNAVMDTVSNDFSVTDVIAPPAVTISGSVSSGHPNISWSAPSGVIDVEEYEIWRYRTVSGGGYTLLTTITGTSYTDNSVTVSKIPPFNKVYYKIKVVDFTDNKSNYSNAEWFYDGSTSKPITKRTERSDIPTNFTLNQNYPNPFNPETKIQFDLPEDSYVRLDIFNLNGQVVAKLVDEALSAGLYTATFDAGSLPSGVYFYRITAGKFSDVKRMMLVK
jgi:hypothetical protein